MGAFSVNTISKQRGPTIRRKHPFDKMGDIVFSKQFFEAPNFFRAAGIHGTSRCFGWARWRDDWGTGSSIQNPGEGKGDPAGGVFQDSGIFSVL